jgi:hypothetical protein
MKNKYNVGEVVYRVNWYQDGNNYENGCKIGISEYEIWKVIEDRNGISYKSYFGGSKMRENDLIGTFEEAVKIAEKMIEEDYQKNKEIIQKNKDENKKQ